MITYPKSFFTLFLAAVLSQSLKAQAPHNTLINNPYQNIDRYLYQKEYRFHTGVKPYLSHQTDTIVSRDTLYPLNSDNKFARWVFKKHFIDFEKNDVKLTIDPIINFELARDNDYDDYSWINTRGANVTISLGKQIAVGTLFTENQSIFNDFRTLQIQQLTQRVIPGQGIAKPYDDNPNGYDYYFSEAYVSYSPSKYFTFQLGSGKNFFGDGYRSLILSDNSFNYPYVKITTDFWRIKYVNLWAQFQHLRGRLPDIAANTKKWGAFQYLSYNVTSWLNISLFESVIWQDRDSLGYRGFDFQYANPVIYLRPVEWSVGSPDNMMVGAAGKITLFKNTALYGQIAFDEFKIDELRNQTGWYANKWAIQAGIKTFDIFRIKHLDFQTEINLARPFMYSHTFPVNNYAHYNQPLAHPLGANFAESVTILRYNFNRFFIEIKNIYARHGSDTAGLNYGNDLFLPYSTYAQEYNNRFFQAKEKILKHVEVTVSYLINPAYNLNLYAGYLLRNHGDVDNPTKQQMILFGLRTSIFNHYWDY
ncbi:MAG TPA: hypothetical protein PK990_01015 [Salinivirgaceae bacterium]|nr:hypothetical protein [Salinivirgaceae bacterium]